MKNGLAIWHYPHRNVVENVAFFADNGFDAVSVLGMHMDKVLLDEEKAEALAKTVMEKGVVLTVHHKLPKSHSEEAVLTFKAAIEKIGQWQKKWGLISILSFDVADEIRDNAAPYIDFVLDNVPNCKIAVEDFGLNALEVAQIEHLKGESRFGYLIDIGHMFIRLIGKNNEGYDLFYNWPEECERCSNPQKEHFLKAIRTKKFPIFEIHLHNNDGIDDLHYFLEDGELDIKMIAEVLKEIEFDGVLTIESAPGYRFKCKYPESDERILKTYEFWKNYLH